jgi:hypothetical protein
MEAEISTVMDDIIKDGVWDEILSPDSQTVLADLTKLSTDYSCQSCSY